MNNQWQDDLYRSFFGHFEDKESEMKRAKVVDILSPGVDDLYSYQPEDPENFCILLQICVGIAGSDSEALSGETFDIEVFTPSWLLSKYHKDEVLFPKHSLIVFHYDFEKIYQKVRDLIESCSGNSWEEITKKIGEFSAWEFEGYQSGDQ